MLDVKSTVAYCIATGSTCDGEDQGKWRIKSLASRDALTLINDGNVRRSAQFYSSSAARSKYSVRLHATRRDVVEIDATLLRLITPRLTESPLSIWSALGHGCTELPAVCGAEGKKSINTHLERIRVHDYIYNYFQFFVIILTALPKSSKMSSTFTHIISMAMQSCRFAIATRWRTKR